MSPVIMAENAEQVLHEKLKEVPLKQSIADVVPT